MTFQNYHRHTYYTNIIIPDSACSIEEYAIRAKELGHGILSSMEHGWQGKYFETYEIAKKYGLKFIFGTEAYFVLDRKLKDGTNCHLCLFARNEKGRRQINEVLSEANVSGYYKVPRLDLSLLHQLSWEDVFITTACVAFYKYGLDTSTDIILKLHNHFKTNFYLEVQYHDMTLQKEINKFILDISNKYEIPIIMGCDSHYIHPLDSTERQNVLHAKNIFYENEENCILDYPDSKTAVERFQKQNILNNKEIETAIKNTNVFLEFEDITFDKNIKLPSIHLEKTQAQKDDIFKNLIWRQWDKFKKEIPEHKWKKYIEEIKKEIICVINTKMTDYFLLDYEIVKLGIKKGGRITLTGRGSSASYFINTLLEFSKIDRISSPVQMYPERFISETRILQTKSLPDLDLNVGDAEPFFEAQKELLGEHSSYQMIAFGTFKVKSAFKLYARAKNIDFQIANNITKQIERYESDLKHADDIDKESINLYDYIDSKFLKIVKESEKYQNVVSDKKPHPCASLILQDDIRKEIGIMRIKSAKKLVYVALMDGTTADEFKFLKNDLLTVDVVNIIHNTFKNIQIKPFSVNKLIQITQNDEKVWDIYAEGKTICLNQVEKDATRDKIMKYKPQNISELTSFIAAIRPSFKSMYPIFEKREKFIYGITAFDEILQTKDIKSSFLIYQEQIMATLTYAGINTSETYGIIKSIAKKKSKQVKQWKDIFLEGFSKKIVDTEGIDVDEALEKSKKVWQIIDDSCQYGFNASHAFSVALDSLYCCYLKAYHTIEFFEETLNYYANKGAKDKIVLIKKEAENEFNIKIIPLKFKNDNRKFVANKKDNTINESMVSVKYLNQQLAKNLFSLRNKVYDSFPDVLESLYKETCIQSNQLEILIKLNYFDDYGDINYLLQVVEIFNRFWQKSTKSYRKQISKEKAKEYDLHDNLLKRFGKERNKTFTCLNSKNIIIEQSNFIIADKLLETEIIQNELEYLGYIRYKTGLKKDRHKVFILDIDFGDHDKINPKIYIYSIGTGKNAKLKIKRALCNFSVHETIHITKISTKPRFIYLGDNEKGKPQFEESKIDKDWWIEKWIKKE